MAISEPPFAKTQSPLGDRHSPSSKSTWYLVIGAAVLLTVLYMMTAGLMRPVPIDEPVTSIEVPVTAPDVTVEPTR